MTTIAEQASKIMGDDGSNWRTGDGRSLEDVCRGLGADVRVGGPDEGTRYVFADSSVITACGSGWDLGYLDCLCWQGAGHREGCEARGLADDHWLGFTHAGHVYGPANPEMRFASRDDAIAFAREEGLALMEHWVNGHTVDADQWQSEDCADA
jgi:hypothetical protein